MSQNEESHDHGILNFFSTSQLTTVLPKSQNKINMSNVIIFRINAMKSYVHKDIDIMILSPHTSEGGGKRGR